MSRYPDPSPGQRWHDRDGRTWWVAQVWRDHVQAAATVVLESGGDRRVEAARDFWSEFVRET